MRLAGPGLVALSLLLPAALAAQPVQGPQDRACRNEARHLVFSAPNPSGLDAYSRGRTSWEACMARPEAPGKGVKQSSLR